MYFLSAIAIAALLVPSSAEVICTVGHIKKKGKPHCQFQGSVKNPAPISPSVSTLDYTPANPGQSAYAACRNSCILTSGCAAWRFGFGDRSCQLYSERIQQMKRVPDSQSTFFFANAVCTPATTASGLANPGFESGDYSGWGTSSENDNAPTIASPGANGAGFAARLSTTQSYHGIAIYQGNTSPFTLCPGVLYDITFKYKLVSAGTIATSQTSSPGRLQMYFANLRGNNLYKLINFPQGQPSDNPSAYDTWTTVDVGQYTYNAGDGPQINFNLQAGDANVAEMWIDDIALTPAS